VLESVVQHIAHHVAEVFRRERLLDEEDPIIQYSTLVDEIGSIS
jgi:hypothetical protein